MPGTAASSSARDIETATVAVHATEDRRIIGLVEESCRPPQIDHRAVVLDRTRQTGHAESAYQIPPPASP